LVGTELVTLRLKLVSPAMSWLVNEGLSIVYHWYLSGGAPTAALVDDFGRFTPCDRGRSIRVAATER